MLDLSVQDWHARYLQQARWTASIRQYLFGKARLPVDARVLEVGCGTGAIMTDFAGERRLDLLVGLDIAAPPLQAAAVHAPEARLAQGDARYLPFTDRSFDWVYCHFLLLWVRAAEIAVKEMARIVQPGGAIMALAEPDYGGRIDHPDGLVKLGILQAQALTSQGADPLAGRKLAGWFSAAGLLDIEYGVLGGQWTTAHHPDEWQMEWAVLEADLAGRLPEVELSALKQRDLAARLSGERLLFVPTCYAFGRVAG